MCLRPIHSPPLETIEERDGRDGHLMVTNTHMQHNLALDGDLKGVYMDKSLKQRSGALESGNRERKEQQMS